MRTYKNFNKPQAKKRRFLFDMPAFARFFSKNLIIGTLALFIVLLVFGVVSYFFYYTYIPGESNFASCKSLFVKIASKPTYGIIVETTGDSINEIHILGKNDQSGPVSINMSKDNWVRVYFSDKFKYAQVNQLLRLSTFETGKTNYCWLAEQLSLLTGVPLEFMIVKDGAIPTVSNARFSDIIDISGKFDKSKRNTVDLNFVDPQILEDGTRVSVLTFTAFQDQFPSIFKVQEVTNEQAFVEIYNSSTVTGYASLVSHKLTMLGIEVSRVGNSSSLDSETSGSIIYVRNKQQYTKTLELVISSLPVGTSFTVKEGRPPNLVTTGDIVVILLKR